MEKTQTAKDGSFALSVLDGVEGQLEGLVSSGFLTSCPEIPGARISGMLGFLSTNSISLLSDSDRVNLRLIVPLRSCKVIPDRK
jgi:hypothetical protein